MSLPSTRTEFKAWCLRKLGNPVSKVNVEDTQVEDRIDEALIKFYKHHTDATIETYITYELTDEDVENNYITLPENVFAVSGIIPLQNGGGMFDRGIFDVRYRIHLSELYSGSGIYKGGNLSYYDMMKGNLALLDRMFNLETSFRFSRYENRLYLTDDLNAVVVNDGRLLAIKAMCMLDVEENGRVWQDDWLQDYTCALIKQQWGMNLLKYNGIQMVGGVSLNGEMLFQQGSDEIRDLEERLRQENEFPPVPQYG